MKTRKLLIIISILISLIITSVLTYYYRLRWITYKNDSEGFSMKCPVNWEYSSYAEQDGAVVRAGCSIRKEPLEKGGYDSESLSLLITKSKSQIDYVKLHYKQREQQKDTIKTEIIINGIKTTQVTYSTSLSMSIAPVERNGRAYYFNGSNTQTVRNILSSFKFTNPTSKINNSVSSQPSPPLIKYKTIDDYVDYEVPNNWKKEISNEAGEDTRSVILKSPNYRYNSAEGKDDGLGILIVRRKFTANSSLKDKLIKDGNPYIDKKDFKLTATAIDGHEGYFFPSNNDGIGFDANYPHLAVLKDGHQYNFLFLGANGNGLRQAVDGFIKSIKFK